MKTTKLQLDYDYDFLLVGMLSTLPDYKLSWGINKSLNIALTREKDLELTLSDVAPEDGTKLYFESPELNPKFSMFEYYDEVTHVKYIVVANKSGGLSLVKEEQSVDFFLLVEGLYDDLEAEGRILNALKHQGGIITAYKIDPNRLKSKENLIFE